MNPYGIQSSDGTELAVYEAGARSAGAIVFIHGYCMSHHIWKRQYLDPRLAARHRLISFDLRGHGSSGKPRKCASYQDGTLWAADLKSVLDRFDLDRACVVAWSYGGRVLNDYVRFYGPERLCGVNFVAAGTLPMPEAIGPGHLTMERMWDDDVGVRESAEEQYVTDSLRGYVDPDLQADLLRAVRGTPVLVRKRMRERKIDYEKELAALRVPTLISHGQRDTLSLPVLGEALCAHMPNARLSCYSEDGHAPFVTSAGRFNLELDEFAATCAAGSRFRS